ncbi:hypothetical protein [Isoptericola dokdonensis]|uniref:Uncharacterized protein n=1 Tax=Isoptericola dokdonensis DS-3 TaxID=1300344 RepID=A0A161HRQ7_9MICO|nr:hypothetical protein [Isoptericola dokdonensis]ANC32012.1 hypothetical protein I598_2475 [Isoptericola dokdonensis DS-3]
MQGLQLTSTYLPDDDHPALYDVRRGPVHGEVAGRTGPGVSVAAPLAVVDDRSAVTALALAWPADDTPDRAGATTVEQARRAAISREVLEHGPDVVDLVWSPGTGADLLTFVLPHGRAVEAAPGLVDVVRSRLEHPDPVVAVVGPAEVVAGTAELTTRRLRPAASPVLSMMRQSRVQGFDQVCVTGADPAAEVGHAATLVALCRAAAGPGSLVPQALADAGVRASVQPVRGLREGEPVVTWHVVCRAGDSMLALETLAATLLDPRLTADPRAIDATRELARESLHRVRRSSQVLAAALAEHAVMGWGGHLLLAPDAALDDVEPADVAEATAALVRPVADALGWEG